MNIKNKESIGNKLENNINKDSKYLYINIGLRQRLKVTSFRKHQIKTRLSKISRIITIFY